MKNDNKKFNIEHCICIVAIIISVILLIFAFMIGLISLLNSEESSSSINTNEDIISIKDDVIIIDRDCLIEIKENENTIDIIINKNREDNNERTY